ncbi:Hypothetical predicted protein, partial [Olea europaea subsp. europaea]
NEKELATRYSNDEGTCGDDQSWESKDDNKGKKYSSNDSGNESGKKIGGGHLCNELEGTPIHIDVIFYGGAFSIPRVAMDSSH